MENIDNIDDDRNNVVCDRNLEGEKLVCETVGQSEGQREGVQLAAGAVGGEGDRGQLAAGEPVREDQDIPGPVEECTGREFPAGHDDGGRGEAHNAGGAARVMGEERVPDQIFRPVLTATPSQRRLFPQKSKPSIPNINFCTVKIDQAYEKAENTSTASPAQSPLSQ